MVKTFGDNLGPMKEPMTKSLEISLEDPKVKAFEDNFIPMNDPKTRVFGANLRPIDEGPKYKRLIGQPYRSLEDSKVKTFGENLRRTLR